jgi:hypothetical protein
MRSIPLVLALWGALFALPGAHATAGPPAPGDAVRDCAVDGDLDRAYPDEVLRRAVDEVPSDLAEYSNCVELLGAAVLGPAGGSPTGGGTADRGDVGPASPDGAVRQGAPAPSSSSFEPSGALPGVKDEPEAGRERSAPAGDGPWPWLLLGAVVVALALTAYLLRDRIQSQRGVRLVARVLGLAPRGS